MKSPPLLFPSCNPATIFHSKTQARLSTFVASLHSANGRAGAANEIQKKNVRIEAQTRQGRLRRRQRLLICIASQPPAAPRLLFPCRLPAQYTGRSAGRLGARPSLAKGSGAGAAAAAAATSAACCFTISTNSSCQRESCAHGRARAGQYRQLVSVWRRRQQQRRRRRRQRR